uniref:Uncharacterized protein n=1 Tax=Rhizophora mucronata TaxID=61149 RepID=A0A2P2QXF2_RHIMU
MVHKNQIKQQSDHDEILFIFITIKKKKVITRIKAQFKGAIKVYWVEDTMQLNPRI